MINSQGGLILQGQNLHLLRSHQVARKGVGLVPEGRRCFTNLSVGENLIAASRPGYWTLNGVAELFPCLEERHDQSAASLSGGERFRVALAQVLLTDPPPQLIVLDEPTNNLDLQTTEQLIDALGAYRGAIIVVSHDRGFLDRLRLDAEFELDAAGLLTAMR